MGGRDFDFRYEDQRTLALGPKDPRWYRKANCIGLPTDVFYEEDHLPLVVQVCMNCPLEVRRDCLAALYVEEDPLTYSREGFRAGTTKKWRDRNWGMR